MEQQGRGMGDENPQNPQNLASQDRQKVGFFNNLIGAAKCGVLGKCKKGPPDPCQDKIPVQFPQAGFHGVDDCCMGRKVKCCDRMAEFSGGDGVDKFTSPCKDVWIRKCTNGEDGYSWEHPKCRAYIKSLTNIGDASADDAISAYCKAGGAGEGSERCGCLGKSQEELDAFKTQHGLAGDFVCWYDPCLVEHDPFLTSTYRQRRDSCKISNCVIKDVHISAQSDNPIPIEIKNQCGAASDIPPEDLTLFSEKEPDNDDIYYTNTTGSNSKNNQSKLLLAGAGALALMYLSK